VVEIARQLIPVRRRTRARSKRFWFAIAPTVLDYTYVTKNTTEITIKATEFYLGKMDETNENLEPNITALSEVSKMLALVNIIG